MTPSGNDSDGAPSSLDEAPWTRLALGYAIGVSLAEAVALMVSPPLFRALVVADAALGWTVVVAAWQGVRALPYPPPVRAILISSLATGHWGAAVVGAGGAILNLVSAQ